MKNKILEYINNKQMNELRDYLKIANNKDISVVMEELKPENMLLVFRLLPKDEGAEVFSEMGRDLQEQLIQSLNDKEIQDIIRELNLDDTVDFLGEMPANIVKKILGKAKEEDRKLINQFLSYPEDSAGSIMTNEFVDLEEGITVKHALKEIKKEGVGKETIYTCYVLDKKRKLIGLVSVRDLILADDNTLISQIMNVNIKKANTLEDKEEVAKRIQKYNFLALPVVDNENRLVGIVTVDDAIQVLQEENTEDVTKMAGVVPSNASYFKTSVFKHARNRLIWLLVLMISAVLTGSIITHYEQAFETLPILVAFIPMLMGTGGNSGSQASTLIIRGLTTEEIKLKDIFKVMAKEFKIAIIVGLTLALIIGIGVVVLYKNIKFAIVIGASLVCTVILAKLLGCVLPMIAKKIKIDPAIMAGPLITTILDACSVLIYFKIATMILKI